MLRAVQKILDKSNFKFEYIDLGGGMGIKYQKNNQKFNYKEYSKKLISL